MKAIGDRLIIKQVGSKKVKKIITLDKDKSEDEVYDSTFTITAISKTCPNPDKLKIGDKVIFGQYFSPTAGKLIEKTPEKLEQDLLVNYTDIVGLETDTNDK